MSRLPIVIMSQLAENLHLASLLGNGRMPQKRVESPAKPSDAFRLSLERWRIELPDWTTRAGFADTANLESALPED
jgi:hypothetical protein